MAKAEREAHAAAMAVDRKREEARRQKEQDKKNKAKQLVADTKQLLSASFEGEEKDVQSFLDRGIGVDACDHLGTTAISEAATGGFPSIATLLLEKKGNPNS